MEYLEKRPPKRFLDRREVIAFWFKFGHFSVVSSAFDDIFVLISSPRRAYNYHCYKILSINDELFSRVDFNVLFRDRKYFSGWKIPRPPRLLSCNARLAEYELNIFLLILQFVAEAPKSVLISKKVLPHSCIVRVFKCPVLHEKNFIYSKYTNEKNATWIVSIILHDNP